MVPALFITVSLLVINKKVNLAASHCLLNDCIISAPCALRLTSKMTFRSRQLSDCRDRDAGVCSSPWWQKAAVAKSTLTHRVGQ